MRYVPAMHPAHTLTGRRQNPGDTTAAAVAAVCLPFDRERMMTISWTTP